MSENFVKDIADMHRHYGFHEKIEEMTPEQLARLLDFRISFLQEEIDELWTAEGPEDVTDALIDLIVVAVGTLDLFKIDAYRAWNEVHRANMTKKAGVNPTRPNPLGLPDLVKPEGWSAPSHEGNHGLLTQLDLEPYLLYFESKEK
ncbi:MAG: pyrophosphohydrolase domain-containing protein [bacterium]